MNKPTCKSCAFAQRYYDEAFDSIYLNCHFLPEPTGVNDRHWCGQHKESNAPIPLDEEVKTKQREEWSARRSGE